MKKLEKKDYINLIILVSLFIGIVLLLTRFNYIYGSVKDWNTQHWIIPEYFRTLFYSTKNILPSFAFNLGAGQNIFNMSYYGLLSPFILLSYLFPFINMMYFMMGISILIVISSVVLMYIWLHNNKFDSKVCFLTSLIFLLSSPLIFHSHRHIMFISYMPFLLLGLMAVDKYFSKNKKSLLILTIFLIIMTSYFYSVASLIVLFMYGTYKYLNKLKRKEKFTIKLYLKWSLKYLNCFFIAIMMASVLLLPTAYSLFSGRSIGNSSMNFLFILIPKVNINFILYGTYSVGLTSIFIVSLIDNYISKKRENRFIVYIMGLISILPLFVYLLNGTMYIDSKVLIPFLPICCLLIGNTLKNFFKKRYNFKKIIGPIIILSFVILIFSKPQYAFIYLLDISVLLLFIYQYNKSKDKDLICIVVIAISLTNCLLVNLNDKLVSIDDAKEQNLVDQPNLINEVLDEDDELYRISNQYLPLESSNRIFNPNQYQSSIYSSVSNNNYKDFYYNHSGNEIIYRSYGMLSSVNNVIYNMYMGNKYILSNKDVPIGYKEVKKEDELTLYKNDNILPIGYASGSLMNKDDYEKLEFPYNSEAILKNIVVDKKIDNKFKSDIKKVNLDYIVKSNKNTIFKKQDKEIQLRAGKSAKMILELNKPIKNQLLFIKFRVDNRDDCKFGDVSISINGVKNKVTCETWKYHNKNYEFDYVISSNDPITELKVDFSKGLHKIRDIETFVLDYDSIKDIKHNIDEFIIDKNKTKGDYIAGDINVSQDKYFQLSIPYDRGFNILVDGEKQNYIKTDLNFIGFEIKKGHHKIEIEYTSPLLKEGMVVSMIGIISFISILWFERRKK